MGNGEEVGKISYSVTIDVSALKAGTKTAEQAIKTSFGTGEKDIQKFAKSADSSFSSVTKSLALLTASFLSLRTISTVLNDSVDAANKFQSSMLGLESVSNAFTGESTAALEAAKSLSSDGLLPLADSATGLKNLLAAGYGLPEAITLMERFKESAAFGRQGSLSFGEAVRSATEGVKNGNSILVDNAGVTKNLSVILQEAGYSAQDLQYASTDVGVRMAILNGIVRETNAQVGDTAKLSDTAAGADARLAFATDQLQVRVGNLANVLRKDAVDGLSKFTAQNQDAIISVGAGATAFLGVATVIPLLVKGLALARTALIAFRSAAIATQISLGALGAISLAVGAIVGGIVYNSLQDLDDASNDASGGTDDLNKIMKDTSGYDRASKSAADLTKKLKELDEQVQKVERDYIESLAKIVQDHQQSVKDITKQIEDENDKYNAALKKRFTSFQEEQGKEQTEHAKKVKNLQNQIDFLQKHQHASNQQQLSDLRFSLAQEKSDFDKRTNERIAAYDAETEAAKLEYDQRLTENQRKLNEELAILNKHRDSVLAVRNVILLDEIEMLKRSRDEQLKSLDKQRQQAIESGAAAGAGYGNAFKTQLVKTAELSPEESKKVFGIGGGLRQTYKHADGRTEEVLITRFATGGFTGRGGKYDVAGLVDRGEYVIPKEGVNQSTGLPKAEALEALGGGGTQSSSTTYTIPITISGAIVSSPQDQRKFAEVIGKKINEVMQQKGFRPALEGM